MSTNEKEFVLKDAHARYVAAFATLTKVEAAFAGEAVPNAKIAEEANLRQKREAARLKLEDCLASRMLDEATAEDEAQARTDLENAERILAGEQSALEAVRLQQGGLNRRLVAAQQSEEEAKKVLLHAEVEWITEELRIADEAYTAQAGEALQSYLRVSACAAALAKRNAAAGAFSYSDDFTIPTIGPVSSAAASARLGGRESGIGKLLFDASRRFGRLPKNDDMERELDQVKSPVTAPARTRFAKVVAALTPGAEK